MSSRSASSYRAQLMISLALIVVGVGVLAIPASSEGRVVLSISEGHGLSAVDAVGVCLLAVSATWLEVLIAIRLPRLALPPRAMFGLGVLAGIGIGLMIASVSSGFFWWWAIGAVALGIAMLILVFLSARR
jgi:hypothetical protein